MKKRGGLFDLEKKQDQLKDLEQEMNKEHFWNNQTNANKICQTVSNLRKEINEYNALIEEIKDIIELSSISEEADFSNEIECLKDKVDKYSKKIYLSG